MANEGRIRAIATWTARCTSGRRAPRLAHALARDAELHRQTFERDRIIGKLACSKMRRSRLPSTASGFAERLLAVLKLLALASRDFLVGCLVDEPILPFADRRRRGSER